jgi:hypothetical protein
MTALQPHLDRLSGGARFDDVLPDIVQAMVAMHAVAPGLHRVLFEKTQLPPTLRAELDGLEDRLVDLTANALAAELDPPPIEPRLSACIVINAIEGLTHRLILHPPAGVTPQAIAREITKLVRAYIQTSHHQLHPPIAGMLLSAIGGHIVRLRESTATPCRRTTTPTTDSWDHGPDVQPAGDRVSRRAA